MSIASLVRDKRGKFTKVKPKSKKTKSTQLFISPKKPDGISDSVKSYINYRLMRQSEEFIECLHIFMMDLEGSIYREELEWED